MIMVGPLTSEAEVAERSIRLFADAERAKVVHLNDVVAIHDSTSSKVALNIGVSP